MARTCKRNHVISGDNAFWNKDKRKAAGGFWTCRKCRNIASAVQRMKKEKPLTLATKRRYCHAGHLVDKSNRYWQADPRISRGGYWRCLECLRSYNRLAQSRSRRMKKVRTPARLIQKCAMKIFLDGDADAIMRKYIPQIVSARVKLASKAPDTMQVFEMGEAARLEILEEVERLVAAEKKNPFKHLHVKPDAEKAWERFDKALRLAAETGENVPNCQGRSAEFVDYDDDDLPSAEDAYRMCYGCPLASLCSSYAEQERPAWGVHGGSVWVMGEPVG